MFLELKCCVPSNLVPNGSARLRTPLCYMEHSSYPGNLPDQTSYLWKRVQTERVIHWLCGKTSHRLTVGSLARDSF